MASIVVLGMLLMMMMMMMMVVVMVMCVSSSSSSGLSYGYYKESCPNVEEIVKEQVEKVYYIHGNAAVSFTRNIFHDCAVQVNTPPFLSLKTVFWGFILINRFDMDVNTKSVNASFCHKFT